MTQKEILKYLISRKGNIKTLYIAHKTGGVE